MSFDHDSYASIGGEESFYLSVACRNLLSVALTLSVIINLMTLTRSFSSTSLTAHPKSKTANQVSLGSIVAKVSADEVVIIFSFLPRSEIMRARVCKVWRDAAKKTIVPIDDAEKPDTRQYVFEVNSLMSYYAMTVMTTALPCLQQLTIGHLGNGANFGWRGSR